MERLLHHRVCKHSKLKYLVKWKFWPEDNNTWEEESNIFNTALKTIQEYWSKFERDLQANKQSDTIVRDVQGELDCPHFCNEPERLYRKR